MKKRKIMKQKKKIIMSRLYQKAINSEYAPYWDRGIVLQWKDTFIKRRKRKTLRSCGRSLCTDCPHCSYSSHVISCELAYNETNIWMDSDIYQINGPTFFSRSSRISRFDDMGMYIPKDCKYALEYMVSLPAETDGDKLMRHMSQHLENPYYGNYGSFGLIMDRRSPRSEGSLRIAGL